MRGRAPRNRQNGVLRTMKRRGVRICTKRRPWESRTVLSSRESEGQSTPRGDTKIRDNVRGKKKKKTSKAVAAN